MNVEPEEISSEAVIAFYSNEKGARRVRFLIDDVEIADLPHDGTMHTEMDRLLALRGLARRSGFHLSPRGLTASLRKVVE